MGTAGIATTGAGEPRAGREPCAGACVGACVGSFEASFLTSSTIGTDGVPFVGVGGGPINYRLAEKDALH